MRIVYAPGYARAGKQWAYYYSVELLTWIEQNGNRRANTLQSVTDRRTKKTTARFDSGSLGERAYCLRAISFCKVVLWLQSLSRMRRQIPRTGTEYALT